MRYAFLNLEEHPRGNYILSRLINAGFLPDLIVEENSRLAIKNRRAVIESLKSHPSFIDLCPTLQNALIGHVIPHLQVLNHNDNDCYNAIIEHDIDFVILGDTRIIKKIFWML